MCSDDALDKNFIDECIKGFQKSPSSSFVMCHRAILNQNNELIFNEPPFYDASYIIPSGLQAYVYMMAAVNPSVSQIMYQREKLINFNFPNEIISRWFGSRIKDFLLSLESTIVYINKPLLLNRVHNNSESNQTTDTMLQIIGNYVLVYLFDEFAKKTNHKIINERLDEAVSKVSSLSLRYSLIALNNKNQNLGFRYLMLAVAIDPNVMKDDTFKKLDLYFKSSEPKKNLILNKLLLERNLTQRTVSYPPPEGSIQIT